jgi:hypothetical protein
MATGSFDWSSFLSGYSPNIGGTGQYGQAIPGMLPGGGAIGGVAGIAGGILDLVSFNKRMKEQQTGLEGAKADLSKIRGDFASGLYNQQVSQAQRDLAMAGIRPTDTSGIQSSAATALQAASMDPRVLGGLLGNMQRTTAQQMQQQQQQDVQREIESRKGLANLEQDVLSQNIGLKQQMGMMGMSEAMQARNQALQNIEQLKANKRDALANIIGGAANIASSAFALPTAEEGAKVKKTPGEFSHATNPIHMLQDGMKIGEMTGGEYIINPEQADEIEDVYEEIAEKQAAGKKISRQELMMLYKVVRGVFSQPQFKD